MTVIHAVILGIVQGLTEFLPISSSAHLNVFPWILGWDLLSEGMDVALHIGTFLALIVFFFKDWLKLIIAGYNQVIKKEKSNDGKIFWHLFFSTLLACGLTLICDVISKKVIGEDINFQMAIIGITLIIMGVILYVVDKKAKQETKYEDITLKQSLKIGASQAIAAAFPGVSRSGISMTVARSLGIDRESSAKFSFMLAMPITLGAIVFDLNKFSIDLPLFLGIIASFVTGILVIKLLMEFIKRWSYKLFCIYRIILGIIILGIYFLR